MAETAKNPRVVSMSTQDGGVALVGLSVQTTITANTTDTARPSLEMELDRFMGGVVIRYQARLGGKTVPKRVLVPMSHIRAIELEA